MSERASRSVGVGFQFEPLGALEPPMEPVAPSAEPAGPAVLDAEREQARRQGHEEGYRAGLGRARSELEPARRALGAAAEEFERARDQLAQAALREAAALGLLVAEKVVAGALEVQPERVLDVLAGALRRLEERQRVTLVVAPEDLELVQEHAGVLADTVGAVGRLEVQADRRIARGGALVRTPEAELDARLASQLERARDVVQAELGAQVP